VTTLERQTTGAAPQKAPDKGQRARGVTIKHWALAQPMEQKMAKIIYPAVLGVFTVLGVLSSTYVMTGM
jgi:hypothetical protein